MIWRDIEGFMLGIAVEPKWYTDPTVMIMLGKKCVYWKRRR